VIRIALKKLGFRCRGTMNCALSVLLSLDYSWARCIVPLHVAGSINRTPTLHYLFRADTRSAPTYTLRPYLSSFSFFFTIYYILDTIYCFILIVFPPALTNTLPFHFPAPNAKPLSNYSQIPDNYHAHNKFCLTNNKPKKN